MVKLNIASVNMVFRKGYLLAGMMMAANMFIVNDVKASNTNDNKEGKEVNLVDKKNEEKKEGENSGLQSFFDKVLYYENTINLIGGAAFSVANSYFKWWDYNAGSYCNLRIGCLGWRTKKFFDIVQVDINLNVGRGISWVILGAYNCEKFIKDEMGNIDYGKYIHVSFLVSGHFSSKSVFIGIFLIQGFVSAPLIFHISNFSISISIDSMLWAGIGKLLDKGEGKEKKGKEEKTLKNIEELNDQYQQNNGDKTFEKGEGTELKDMDQNKNNNQNLNDEEESNNNEEQEEKDENIND